MTDRAVTRLRNDIQQMRNAHRAQAHAAAAEKTAIHGKRVALATVNKQEKQVVDAFHKPGAVPSALHHQLTLLRKHEGQVKDRFDKSIGRIKHSEAKHQQAAQAGHKRAMGDLLPAEEKLGLKATNWFRHALGLHSVKKVIRSNGSDAIKAARSVFGRNIQDLKFHGPLAKFLDRSVSSHVCCANFVSACLEKAGLMSRSLHSDTVRGLASNLAGSGNFKHVSSSHLQPGDVVCFNVPGEGPMSHVEMFQGYRHGQAIFIGSNNRNPDGSQRISSGPVGYGIDAVLRHR